MNQLLRSVLVLLFLTLILSGHAALLLLNHHDLCDDAMISARYARNLAHGDGLRYNRAPAMAKPVEGYSNFLWVLGMAVGEKLGASPRLSTAMMGAAFSSLCVTFLCLWVFSRTRSWALALLSAALLASSLPFAIWAMQGLETAAFAFFVMAALGSHRPARPGPLPWLFSLLACLTRPDGLLVPLMIAIREAVQVVLDQRKKDGGRRTLRKMISKQLQPGSSLRRRADHALLFFVLPFIAYTVLRLAYFGALLPAPLLAKTGYGLTGLLAGAWYVADWIKAQWPLAGLLTLSLALFALREGRRIYQRKRFALREGRQIYRHELFAPALLILSYLLFVVVVGGDFMPSHRFIMHLTPLMIGFFVIALTGLDTEKQQPIGRRATLAIYFLLVVAFAWNAVQGAHYFRHPSFAREWHQKQAEWYGLTASWLLRHSRPEQTIAAGDIGYIGYVTDVDRIIDANGLVDFHLSRLPGAASLVTDFDYILGERPDFIVVMVHYYDGVGGAAIGQTAFDRSALSDPRVADGYRFRVEVPGWSSEEFSFDDFQRRASRVFFRIYEKNPER